ncbi:hypothetical protein HKBW3S44_00282, partial [Candidatus Hakubella thermalkaliphila]
RISLFES